MQIVSATLDTRDQSAARARRVLRENTRTLLALIPALKISVQIVPSARFRRPRPPRALTLALAVCKTQCRALAQQRLHNVFATWDSQDLMAVCARSVQLENIRRHRARMHAQIVVKVRTWTRLELFLAINALNALQEKLMRLSGRFQRSVVFHVSPADGVGLVLIIVSCAMQENIQV